MREVTFLVDLSIKTEYLNAFRDRNGDFPAMLADAMPADLSICCDGWENPFHYEHRPGGFVLVSFGNDGKPDITDYWQLREKESKFGGEGKFTNDQVISDRGWHGTWGK